MQTDRRSLAVCQHPTGHKTRRSECHLRSNVDEVHDASPAAAGQQRKGGTGLVGGPNPAALQITLLTILTGTSQSRCTVYVQQGEPGDIVPAQTVSSRGNIAFDLKQIATESVSVALT